MPPAFLPIAAVVALIIVWPRLYQQPSNARLFAEALGTTFLIIAVFWAGWAALWWVEQRW